MLNDNTVLAFKSFALVCASTSTALFCPNATKAARSPGFCISVESIRRLFPMLSGPSDRPPPPRGGGIAKGGGN